MFEKLDEYLVNIYMNQEVENNFNIFKMVSKNNYSIGGFLEDSNDAYLLYRKDNKFGLKVNNGQYLFFYSREKYINSQGFKDILENDSECDKDELRDKFKDVECVTLGERDEKTGNGQKMTFLVNKSSYLVTSYYRIYEDDSNVSVSYDKDLLNLEELAKLHIFNPVIPNFNIAKVKKENIVLLVSDSFHEYFIIKENLKYTSDLFFRRSIVKKMSNEAIEADRRSYTIIRDFDECAKKLNEILNQRFGNNFEGR